MMNFNSDIKVLFFDLDETLVSRKTAFTKFCLEFIDKFKYALHEKVELDILLDYMLKSDNCGKEDRLTFFKLLFKHFNLSQEQIVEFSENWSATFPSYTVVMPDCYSVLYELKKTYRLGLITNGLLKSQSNKIRIAQLSPFFDVIVISGEIGISKPNRDIFLYACEKMGVLPEEAIYIGDNYENDYCGAMAAGMNAIWLAHEAQSVSENINYIKRLSDILYLVAH